MLISKSKAIKQGRMNYLFIGKYWSNGSHVLLTDKAYDSTAISK